MIDGCRLSMAAQSQPEEGFDGAEFAQEMNQSQGSRIRASMPQESTSFEL
jgi:hypothetical protein